MPQFNWSSGQLQESHPALPKPCLWRKIYTMFQIIVMKMPWRHVLMVETDINHVLWGKNVSDRDQNDMKVSFYSVPCKLNVSKRMFLHVNWCAVSENGNLKAIATLLNGVNTRNWHFITKSVRPWAVTGHGLAQRRAKPPNPVHGLLTGTAWRPYCRNASVG